MMRAGWAVATTGVKTARFSIGSVRRRLICSPTTIPMPDSSAARAVTAINQAELLRLWRRLQPLATDKMPPEVPPPRTSRFGSPLVLSRVHWVRPELVAEVAQEFRGGCDGTVTALAIRTANDGQRCPCGALPPMRFCQRQRRNRHPAETGSRYCAQVLRAVLHQTAPRQAATAEKPAAALTPAGNWCSLARIK